MPGPGGPRGGGGGRGPGGGGRGPGGPGGFGGGPRGGFRGGPRMGGPRPPMHHRPPMYHYMGGWGHRPPPGRGCCGCFGPMWIAAIGVIAAVALLLF